MENMENMGSSPSGIPPQAEMKKPMRFKPNKNSILLAVAVLAILVTGALLVTGAKGGSSVLSFLNVGGMSTDQVAKKSIDYLNSSVLQQGQTAQLVSATEESGVVHLKISIGGTNYDSYATKDGKLLFPEAFTVGAPSGSANSSNQNAQQVTPDTVAKVDNTMLEAYVVSSCPYGLQMQRAIAEAIKTAPDLAQHITVRYIGAVSGNTITAMHGPEEAQENLRQICIRDEQPAKYWNYVSCYMKNATGTAANGMPYGDSATCQTAAGIDKAKLNACVADPARGLADAQADFDLQNKYKVQGSPTLVLNGSTITEDGFGGRSANAIGKIICSSSTTAPSFCQNSQLSTDQAATSFSVVYAGSGATGTTANCAPSTN
jgi:hypothetical protein